MYVKIFYRKKLYAIMQLIHINLQLKYLNNNRLISAISNKSLKTSPFHLPIQRNRLFIFSKETFKILKNELV